MLAGRDRERTRERPGLDPSPARRRVDLDPAHPLGLEEERVPAPVDRTRVVAAGVEGNLRPRSAARERCRRLVGGFRVDDGDGALVDRGIPRLSRCVPGLVGGLHDVAVEAVAEFTKFHVPPRTTSGNIVTGARCLAAIMGRRSTREG